MVAFLQYLLPQRLRNNDLLLNPPSLPLDLIESNKCPRIFVIGVALYTLQRGTCLFYRL